MHWFRDLSIKGKLLVAFGTVGALGLIVGLAGIEGLRSTRQATADMVSVDQPVIIAALTAVADVRSLQRDARQSMLVADHGTDTKWRESFDAENRDLQAQFDSLTKYVRTPDGIQQVAALRMSHKEWFAMIQGMVDDAAAGKLADARAVLTGPQNARAVATLNGALTGLIRYGNARVTDGNRAVEDAASHAITTMLLALALMVVISAAIALGIARTIGNGLRLLVQRQKQLTGNCVAGLRRGVQALADGDLSVHIEATTQPLTVTTRDEVGVLTETFNVALGDTKHTIEEFVRAQQVVAALITEVDTLAIAGREGRLDKRGDASHFSGTFATLVTGLNGVLDAIVAPLDEATRVLETLAARDLTQEVHGSYAGDHARIQHALNTAIAEMRNAMQVIGGNVRTLASSSDEVSGVAAQIGSAAEETSSQAASVSAASDQVSSNLATVAAATEQMTASIREIAKSAAIASSVVQRGVTVAADASATMQQLGTSSAEISQVTKMITSIAEQTNLLALNATIEAARAGESGKGFAVVAGEVKELARQTADATEEIGRKIEAIQQQTASAVRAIGLITSVVNEVNDLQSTIASAVEEQTAVTQEMSRNVAAAAFGGQEISRAIMGVAEAAQLTSRGVHETQAAAEGVSRVTGELAGLVERFIVDADQRAVPIERAYRVKPATSRR